ncbi:MAG: hypothetical protein H7Y00_16115 [Fimbriimonadaceae bacterium]|nr:hypothetical protein [Chitinophagales bacterium]
MRYIFNSNDTVCGFKRCLMNATHVFDDENDHTIYSTVFESIGIRFNRKTLKNIVRNYAYIFLGIFTFIL